MFREIRLEALGVIADASVDLGPGFTAITGETGAGKTMLVTALSLLRGGRADAGLVRHGAHRTRVEARVAVFDIPAAAAAASAAGGELDDDEILILGRTVTDEGRSRAFLGGAGVPASALATISDLLFAVHGQADQHRLLRPVAQRAALDRFTAERVTRLLDDYRPGYRRLQHIDATLAELLGAEQQRLRELDVLRHGLAEIAAVEPTPGEDDELRAEEDRLGNADALSAAAASAHEALVGGDGESPDAHSIAVSALRILEGQAAHDSVIADLAERVGEVSVLLTDIATDLADYASRVETDPVRLGRLQERRAALAGLTRKYGRTLTDVLAWAKESAPRVAELEAADERIDALRVERSALVDRLPGVAGDLSRARREAATRLGQLVTSELQALAMPHARVDVVVRPLPGTDPVARLGPDGADEVEMLLAANAGTPARPLAKGASGGELSRVMLALEVVLADTGSAPTLVFDEVDAGVGGKAAVEVGRRLGRLARTAQVVAVTHLPQVAAFAQRHYRVVKRDDGTVTTSGVQMLDEPGRVQELSRMLAGLEGSTTAEAHARELLEMAVSDDAG